MNRFLLVCSFTLFAKRCPTTCHNLYEFIPVVSSFGAVEYYGYGVLPFFFVGLNTLIIQLLGV